MEDLNDHVNPETTSVKQGPSKDERTWALIAHISAIAGFVIPFGNVIAPLLIWVLKKDEFPFVNDQGKEALNFQISITVYALISIILIFVLIGIPILIIVGIFALVMTVVGAINAYDGKAYRYPLTFRLIK